MLKYMIVSNLLCLLTALPFISSESWILNKTVLTPLKYEVKITTYIEGERKYTFDGEVKITVIPSLPTTFIQLNGHKSYFSTLQANVTIKDNPNDESLEIINMDSFSNEIIHMEFNKELEMKKEYVLHFLYIGIISDDMLGLYRSEYVDDGNEEMMMVTQLQQTEARKLMPCFDEPEYKATFVLTLNYPLGYTVRANTLPIGPPEVIG